MGIVFVDNFKLLSCILSMNLVHSRLNGICFALLQFSRKSSQEMVEFLQSSVGIIHKNHAVSITTFIKKSVDEELKEDSSDLDVQKTPKKRLTFCVE